MTYTLCQLEDARLTVTAHQWGGRRRPVLGGDEAPGTCSWPSRLRMGESERSLACCVRGVPRVNALLVVFANTSACWVAVILRRNRKSRAPSISCVGEPPRNASALHVVLRDSGTVILNSAYPICSTIMQATDTTVLPPAYIRW